MMVHQPVHPYQSVEGWVAYHREVAAAIPDHGVVLYVRSPLVGVAGFRALADACPNVVGVKYAVPDPIALADLIRAFRDDRLVWSCGLAESFAPYFWLSGARGFTSGLATVAPQRSLALLAALRAGDFAGAMAIWQRLRPFEEMRARRANGLNVSVVKEALAQLGLCRPDVRPPSENEAGAAPLSRRNENGLTSGDTAGRPPPGPVVPGDHDVPPFSLGGQDLYAISPDGQEICFTSNIDEVEATSTNNELFTVPITGGTPKKLTSNPARVMS